MTNELLNLIEERFSARKFTTEPVDDADIKYVLECVRMAPSACNKQPWKWLVVTSAEGKAKLQQCYDREWFRTAPMYVVGMRSKSENWVRKEDGKAHGDIDVAIATEHLCLAATERGLGTCWVCNYDPRKMHELFECGPLADYEAVVIVPIGHIAEDCPRAEKKCKNLEDIVSFV